MGFLFSVNLQSEGTLVLAMSELLNFKVYGTYTNMRPKL